MGGSIREPTGTTTWFYASANVEKEFPSGAAPGTEFTVCVTLNGITPRQNAVMQIGIR